MKSKSSQDDIVVTGISGRYPGSENIDELWDNLMKGKKLYVPDKFPYPNVFSRYPKVRGALKDASKFDGEFFGFDDVESHALDPQIRQLLEVVYESMWDAGIAPEEWKGTRTGLFLGSSFDDTGLSVRWDHKIDFPQYFSQRVSYFYDFRGPTMIVDTACASSLNALHQAYWSIKQGECDQAIVAGISIHLKPQISICFAELEMLSKSGDSRCLDIGADGYVRSEGIVAVVLQKRSSARRICAKMLASVTSTDGYTKEGITFPSEQVQIETMKNTIAQAGLIGLDVNYVEAHITGTAAGDPIESSSILNSYRPDSNKPIMLGCLKSSIGHAEAAAGLCALSKVLKIFETGLIPPNINMNTPNPKIDGLMDGRILPITKVTEFTDKYVGIDAFGFGGANTHCIVQNPNSFTSYRKMDLQSDIPRLVCLCNRTELGITEMRRFFAENKAKIGPELLAMIDNIAKSSVKSGLNWRSFFLLNPKNKTIVDGQLARVDKAKELGIILDQNFAKLYQDLKNIDVVNESISMTKTELIKKSTKQTSQHEIYSQQIAIIELLHNLNVKPKWIVCQSEDIAIAKYACGSISKSELINHLAGHDKDIMKLMPNGGVRGNEHSSEEQNNKVIKSLLSRIKNSRKNDKNPADELHLISQPKSSHNQPLDLSSVVVLSLGAESQVFDLTKNIEAKAANSSSSKALESFVLSLGQLYVHGFELSPTKLYPQVTYPVSCQVPRLGHLLKWQHDKSYDNTIYPEFFRPSFHTVHRIDVLDQNFSEIAGYNILEQENIFPAAGYLWIVWDHLVKMRCQDQKLRNHSFELWSTKIHGQATITEPIEFRMVSDPVTNQFVIKLGGKVYATGFARIVDKTTQPFDYAENLMLNCSENEQSPIKLEGEEFYQEMSIRGYDLAESYRLVTDFYSNGFRGSVNFSGNWITFVQACLQLYLINDPERNIKVPNFFQWLRCDPEFLYEAQILKRKTRDDSGLPVMIDKVTRTITVNGLVMSFPEHESVERNLAPQDLHYKTQIFLPFTSTLPLSGGLSARLKKYINECEDLVKNLGKKTSAKELASDFDENDLMNVLKRDCKKFLEEKQRCNCLKSNAIVDQVVLELSSFLIDLFEENAPNDVTIMIKQLNDRSPSFEEELDLRFRKIRNRYQFCIGKGQEEDEISTSSVDLLIINHESLDLMPGKREPSNDLTKTLAAMKPSSFLLVNMRETVSTLEKTLSSALNIEIGKLESVENVKNSVISANFVTVSQVSSGDSEIVSILFKKKASVDLEKPARIVKIDAGKYQWVDEIKKAISETENECIWLVANDSYRNGITGLGCSLKEEKFGPRIRVIFAPGWDVTKNPEVFKELREKDVLINVLKNNCWGTFRHIDLEPSDEVKVVDRRYLLKWSKKSKEIAKASPTWFKSRKIDSPESVITSYFAPVNHFDLIEACNEMKEGKTDSLNPWTSCLGYEFAGINSKGQKIVGICNGTGLSDSIAESKVLLSVEVPKDWTLRDASTVTTAYSIAFYSLFDVGRVQKSSTVLLNGMRDGIGEAVIAIGQKMDFCLMIIVDDLSSQNYLLKLCPQLKSEQIIVKNNRVPLDEVVLKKTNGLGVQVIVNLNPEENLHLLADCSSFSGTIINLNSRDCPNAAIFDGARLPNNTTLVNINPSKLIKDTFNDPIKYKKFSSILTNHLKQGFSNGTIRPITAITYRPEQIDEAVEMLENFSGKVLIQFREETTAQQQQAQVAPSHSESFPTKCLARTMFYPHKWYIILGGLGGVGLQLAQWMISRGARKLVLASRSGVKNNYQRYVLNRLENLPVKVEVMIHQDDKINYESCAKLIEKLKPSGPIGGVFNLAAVLSSGLFENQTPKAFSQACPSKVDMTEHWDKATRKECPELDHFVVFSSIASHGILGEANYSYSNAYIERVVEERTRDGLPALAIQFGRIGDVGMATGYTSNIAGSSAQCIWSVIEAIDKFMQLPYPICYSVMHASKKVDKDGSKSGLLQRIGHILGIANLDSLDPSVTLSDLGLDSLQAIEVQQLIESTCGISLPNIGIVKLTIANLLILRDQAMSGEASDNQLKQYSEDVLITLSEKNKAPIFFFPPALFDFLSMLPLAEAMNRTVIGVDLSVQVRELGTLEKIAEFYADKIEEKFPELERYDFVGYSYGCLIGFEVAKVLQRRLPKERCDRIAFIDASPYGLKKLGQNTMQCVLSGLPVSEIFCNTMGHMGVRIEESMRRRLREAEDDEEVYSELVNNVMSAAGMNAPADAFAKSSMSMIDRGYYLSEMKELGIFRGDALFIQVINKVHHGQETLVNEGLEEIIEGNIIRVTYDASHFAILKEFSKEIAANIEEMMPIF